MKPRGERRKRPAARSRGAAGLRRTQAAKKDDAAPVMFSAAGALALGTGFSSKVCSSKTVPADASPDSKCPICLDRFENVSYLDRCLHRFCFRCIQEWAKNKAECPLCKQPFYSILHSVQAEDNFQEFVLRPSENGSFGSPDGSRFRYRSTLTRERRSLLNSRRNNISRTVSPPDNGILFEGLTGQPPQQGNDGIHEMIRRLASRRQASAEGRSMRQIQEQDIINFRRALYRSGVRVRGIQDGGRFRDISSEFYRSNPACLHRLVPWLKRELTVLFGAHGSLVNIVQQIIMSNVTRYDLESQAFAQDLRPFLLHRTEHFLHELISFARCPYNMEAYDQHSNYDCPAPSYEEGSHSDSTVITISPEVGEGAETDVHPSDLGVGQAPWDDETPGPSYSTLEPGPTTVSSLSVSSESSDEEISSNGAATQIEVKVDPGPTCEEVSPAPVEDCLIVGFVKPLAERTPELVELSSDSEGSLIEMKSEETKKPAHSRFNLFSDDSESNHSSAQSSTVSKTIADESSKNKGKLLESTKSPDLKNGKTGFKKVEEFLSSTSKNDRKNSLGDQEVLRKRSKSRSSESLPPFSQGRVRKHRSRHHSKERLRNKNSRSRERIRKNDKDKKQMRSRDRSLSMRSQTVSITSGSSKSGGRSRSKSREHRRSRSRDKDYDHPRENYRSSYQWEYTYYSRNRDRVGYEQSYRSSRGQYQMTSPEYTIQSYSERKNTWAPKSGRQGGQRYNERHRSRSRSSSQSRTMSSGMDWSRSEKPSGKRKYKTRHLENQGGAGSQKDVVHVHGKENSPHIPSPLRYNSQHRNEGSKESRGDGEAKHRRRKKTRSSSVEIVYEGKATDLEKCRKKKKKKHKKKRRRHHRMHSTNTSPVVITIDSDSDHGANARKESVLPNTCTTATSPMKGESCTATTFSIVKPPDMYASLDDIDILGTDDDILDRDCENTTSSGRLDAATGILDDFHFDESSNDQPLGAMEESDSSQDSSVLGAFASSGETSQTGLLASPPVPPSPLVQATTSPPVHAMTSPPVHATTSPLVQSVASPPMHAAASPKTHAVVLSLPCKMVLQSACTSDLPSTSQSSPALPLTHSSTSSPVSVSPLVTASPPTVDLASYSHISEEKTSKKPPLLLTFPKSLMDTTYLFDQSDENT